MTKLKTIQQTLHGYLDGHRLLSKSITLPAKDARTMLSLSDVSGPGLRFLSEGYLTGYRLPEAPFYVLARTWPAPEMPRPGCVWTQSLLIPLEALEEIRTPQELLPLFVRPSQSSQSRYSEALSVTSLASKIDVELMDRDWIASVVWSLYSAPASKIVSRTTKGDVATSVLAIWLQQWPSLRREFRFCTAVTMDRSLAEASFDLQIIEEVDRRSRTRFTGSVDLNEAPARQPKWLELAVADLCESSVSTLSQFFHEVSLSSTGGRRADFPVLCELFSLLNEDRAKSETVDRSIELLRSLPLMYKVRPLIIARVLDGRWPVTKTFFSLLFEESDEVLSEKKGVFQAFVERLLGEDPNMVAAFAGEPLAGPHVREAIANLPDQYLWGAVSRSPDLGMVVLRAKPAMALVPSFWGAVAAVTPKLLANFKDDLPMLNVAIDGILRLRQVQLADAIVLAVGSETLLKRLVSTRVPDEDLSAWLAAASRDLRGVGEFLSSARSADKVIVQALSTVLHPDAIEKPKKRDPWALAIENGFGGTPPNDYIAAYLFCRALGKSSQEQARLCGLSFEYLHEIEAAGRMSNDAWTLLEGRLPRSDYWFDWDRCMRLRAAFVEVFVQSNLAPVTFSDVIKDDRLFGALSSHAMYDPKGRDYVANVRDELRRRKKPESNRLRMLDRILE